MDSSFPSVPLWATFGRHRPNLVNIGHKLADAGQQSFDVAPIGQHNGLDLADRHSAEAGLDLCLGFGGVDSRPLRSKVVPVSLANARSLNERGLIRHLGLIFDRH